MLISSPTEKWLWWWWDWITRGRPPQYEESKEVWTWFPSVFFLQMDFANFDFDFQRIPRMLLRLWVFPRLTWSRENLKSPSSIWVVGRGSAGYGRITTRSHTVWCLWWTPAMCSGFRRRERPWRRFCSIRASLGNLCLCEWMQLNSKSSELVCKLR